MENRVFEQIKFQKEDGVATIKLNRPEAMNSFTPVMIAEINSCIEDISSDDGVRVVVLTGEGRAFCTGADVKAMAAGKLPMGKAQSVEKPIYVGIHNLEKPVIASINGLAVGGGLDLACACDIRISSDKARFAEVFIRRGLIPAGGGIYFLPRLLGIDKACELIFSGDMIDAMEALRIGLVTRVVPHEDLELATMEFAFKLGKGPPLALREAKKALYKSFEMSFDETMEYVKGVVDVLKQTEDHKEGAKAFVEKREALFIGR
ncbi:MAG: enoyl-CoA hydratase [Thermodesulfobacteriota bacterium]|nr:enoyl-CoA hydratase [Thermodesulfobacteriota bacterium]